MKQRPIALRGTAQARFVEARMTSLRQLLADHGPALLLDAASSRIQVGWLSANGVSRWESGDEEAGVSLFRCIESLGVSIADASAFIYCDGPGSILGIRSAAMALRTWRVLQTRPVYAYSSLALVAHALARSNLSVIADARRDAWHRYRVADGLRRVPITELSGELVMPANFRHWASPPNNVQTVPYSVADLLPRVIDLDLFRPTDDPDAFLHEEPSYVTWQPQIHRAPTSL